MDTYGGHFGPMWDALMNNSHSRALQWGGLCFAAHCVVVLCLSLSDPVSSPFSSRVLMPSKDFASKLILALITGDPCDTELCGVDYFLVQLDLAQWIHNENVRAKRKKSWCTYFPISYCFSIVFAYIIPLFDFCSRLLFNDSITFYTRVTTCLFLSSSGLEIVH